MDPTLNWKKAEVTEINENYVVLKLEKNLNAKIYKSNLNWAIKNKTIEDVFEIGDIMFIKKNNNSWSLKQYPIVNGGIVALHSAWKV